MKCALTHDNVAFITIGPRGTQLAIFIDGVLHYSRQIDVGALDFAPQKHEDAETHLPAEDVKATVTLRIDSHDTGLDTLLFEIQRSLDFYHRESPVSGRVERVVLCGDTERLSGLDSRFSSLLKLPVSYGKPLEGYFYNESQIKPEYLAQMGSNFAPAVGLALGMMGEVPQAPLMDLSTADPEGLIAKAAPRRLSFALWVSIIMVVLAFIACMGIERTIRVKQQRLENAKRQLLIVTNEEAERKRAAEAVLAAQAIVQVRGLPWSRVLDQISAFTPTQVGLTSLGTDNRNVLTLQGDARNLDGVANLMDSLTRSTLFRSPQFTSTQQSSGSTTTAVKFQIKVKVKPPPQEMNPNQTVIPASSAAASTTGAAL